MGFIRRKTLHLASCQNISGPEGSDVCETRSVALYNIGYFKIVGVGKEVHVQRVWSLHALRPSK